MFLLTCRLDFSLFIRLHKAIDNVTRVLQPRSVQTELVMYRITSHNKIEILILSPNVLNLINFENPRYDIVYPQQWLLFLCSSSRYHLYMHFQPHWDWRQLVANGMIMGHG